MGKNTAFGDSGTKRVVSLSQATVGDDQPSAVRLEWRHQLRALAWLGLFVYLPAVLLLGVALIQTRAPIPDLFRDLNTVAEEPFYEGFYSQLGALFWCSTAAVCLFSWAVVRGAEGVGERAAFLLAAGALTTLLLLDDMFMVHEAIMPKLIPNAEMVMYLFYAVASAVLVLRFRRVVAGTPFLILLVALGLLGSSEAIDMWAEHFVENPSETFTAYRIFVEDGGKFLGILGWFVYFASVCAGTVGDAICGKQAGNR